MTVRRLAAIAVIFIGASLAWVALGSSLVARTGQFDSRLEREVELLWGAPHRQVAPNAWILQPSTDTETVETKEQDGRVTRRQISRPVLRTVAVPLEQTRATVALDLEHRRKGLLWYPTYTVSFTSTYRFTNPDADARDFGLTMRTNFRDVDFPPGTISPTSHIPADEGAALSWTFANLISGQAIGMELPEKLNPGPFAARVTFFAPVSLLFFLTAMVLTGATFGPSLHPMHYWFIAAAFFAFHLLLAYLVDHINVHAAFAAATAVSLALVVSYLRAVTPDRRALATAAVAQVIFLVLFSYAFFFEGFTGLTITIGAIITLFVLMQMTARVSWDAVFAGEPLEDRQQRPVLHAKV